MKQTEYPTGCVSRETSPYLFAARLAPPGGIFMLESYFGGDVSAYA